MKKYLEKGRDIVCKTITVLGIFLLFGCMGGMEAGSLGILHGCLLSGISIGISALGFALCKKYWKDDSTDFYKFCEDDLFEPEADDLSEPEKDGLYDADTICFTKPGRGA